MDERLRRARGTPDFLRALWTVRRGAREGAAFRERGRRRRLAEIVAWARARSPAYAELYAGLPDRVEETAALPRVTKAHLMERFDRWITDPRVDRARVEAFMARPENLGRPFGPDGGLACRTSGSSGVHGVVLHDRRALRIYGALWGLRGYLAWLGVVGYVRASKKGSAALLAVTEHYTGAAWSRWAADTFGGGRRFTLLPASLPRADLTRELERLRPGILSGYPSALEALAASEPPPPIAPVLVVTSGAATGKDAREAIGEAFGCPVRDAYSASEFPALAFDCERGWLHVNDDFVILEPVDAAGDPALPGVPSATALVTNLVNRVQPILRYDLGDSVLVRPDPCGCGSDLPAIRVEGRRQDLLRFLAGDGATVAIPGNAVLEIVGGVEGIDTFQAIQTDPRRLRVRLAAAGGDAADELWAAARGRLKAFFEDEGLPGVAIERDPTPPREDPRSGKFHAVWSEVGRRDGPVDRP